MRAILTADPAKYVVKPSSTVRPLLGAGSIVSLSGEEHRLRRRLLWSGLHGQWLQGFADAVIDSTLHVFSQQEMERPFPLRQAMRDLTLMVMARIIFGLSATSTEPLERRFVSLLDTIFRSPASLWLFRSVPWDLGRWSPRGSFNRDLGVLDDWIFAAIGRQRDRGTASSVDLLSLLLAPGEDGEARLSDGEVRDEVATLLFAGHETTSSALAWALYWIDRTPEVKAALMAELKSLPSKPTTGDIIGLPYLDAVCQETLRISSPTPLTRRVLIAPLDIDEFSFSPGTVLVPCFYLTHRREDLYPQPGQFRPERFLERRFGPYEYLPLGAGEHRCIGDALVPFEMKLVLATLLTHFRVGHLDRRPVRAISHGPTLALPSHIQMVLTQREGEPFLPAVRAERKVRDEV